MRSERKGNIAYLTFSQICFVSQEITQLASCRWANVGNGWHSRSGICNVEPTLATGRKTNSCFSTSAYRQIQTSILHVFADSGPTLAQGNNANCHFVNVSPPSATDVYPSCICRHWATVGSIKVKNQQ